MAGSKFTIGIKPRNYPSNVADAVHFDAQALTDEKVQETVQVDYKVPRSISRPDIAKDLGVYEKRVQAIEAELEQGAGLTPSSITFEPAKKAALMMEKKMHDMGLIQEVNRETESDSEGSENAEVSDEGDTEQEETQETIETLQGNEIEVARVETEYSESEVEETDEYLASDYGKWRNTA